MTTDPTDIKLVMKEYYEKFYPDEFNNLNGHIPWRTISKNDKEIENLNNFTSIKGVEIPIWDLFIKKT